MSIVLQGSTSGSITLQEPAVAGSNTINLPAATGTMALLQTPSFATTIGVGGATPSASGAGITFPATQSASTDANTLDDYEEGTWTPTNPDISFAGGTFGLYTKVGNMVYCAFKIVYPSTANANPSKISGLPFTSGNYTDSCWGGYMTYSTYTTAPIQPLVGSLSTITDFYRNGSTNGPTNAQLSGLQVRGVIIYQV